MFYLSSYVVNCFCANHKDIMLLQFNNDCNSFYLKCALNMNSIALNTSTIFQLFTFSNNFNFCNVIFQYFFSKMNDHVLNKEIIAWSKTISTFLDV